MSRNCRNLTNQEILQDTLQWFEDKYRDRYFEYLDKRNDYIYVNDIEKVKKLNHKLILFRLRIEPGYICMLNGPLMEKLGYEVDYTQPDDPVILDFIYTIGGEFQFSYRLKVKS